MNTFSSMEISDLLGNGFRLEDRHGLPFLAECFQRLFPTLGRVGLSTVIHEMARANHRAFSSSHLPIRGETLNLAFFFEIWKRNFRFENTIYDKCVFNDELKLAFKINPREFWEILIRANRDLGTYIKDCFELFGLRALPREINFTLRAGQGTLEYQYAYKIKELLTRTNGSLVRLEDVAKACIGLWGMPPPKFFDERRVVEELCRENNIKRVDREPCVPFPIKNIANLSVGLFRKATEDRARKVKRSAKDEQTAELSYQEPLLRGDYRGTGDPVDPPYPSLEHRQDGGTMQASFDVIQFLINKEGFVPYFYYDKDPSKPKKRYIREEVKQLRETNNKKYGRITIGYGFTLKWHPELDKYFDIDMAQTEAEQIILDKVHNEYAKQVNRETSGILLTQNQFDALCSVMYNVGLGNFKDSKIQVIGSILPKLFTKHILG